LGGRAAGAAALAVFLRYFADLGYREIAAALEIETGTVSATLSAAHAGLRRAFQEVQQ
jgi:DNA-directed RNA polymerase specialized sigma24 family protein